MDFIQQAFRTSWCLMTKYRFFHHIISPLEFKDKHTRAFHKTLFWVYYPGRLTIRSHIVLWHSKLSMVYVMDDYILWFDVTVNDAKRMDFIDRLADLLDYWCDFVLCHGLWSFKLVEELPACSYLKNNIDVVLVIKVAIHLDDIWMIKIELYFEFPDELLDDVFLLDQLLLDHLQSADEPWVFLPQPITTYCTKETCPYLPDPSSLIFLKSFTLTFLFFPRELLLQI